MRKSFSDVMHLELKSNDRSLLILGDIGVNSHRRSFEDFPERVMNIGILEQSMVGVAAGFSSEGFIPTVHTIAPFVVERAYEQLKIDFGYQRLPGNLVTVGASLDYSELGPTHHCPADVSLLLNVPGFEVFVPGHEKEFKKLFSEFSRSSNLSYFRLSETENHDAFLASTSGEGVRVRQGSEILILAIGPVLDMVLDATEGINATIIYINSLNPFDVRAVSDNLFSNRAKILVVEPFFEGSSFPVVYPALKNKVTQIEFFGVPRKFHTNYGSVTEHLRNIEFTHHALKDTIKRMIIAY